MPYYSTNLIHAYAIEERMNELGTSTMQDGTIIEPTRSKSLPCFCASSRNNAVGGNLKRWGRYGQVIAATEIRRRTVTPRALLWCTIINYGILLVWISVLHAWARLDVWASRKMVSDLRWNSLTCSLCGDVDLQDRHYPVETWSHILPRTTEPRT